MVAVYRLPKSSTGTLPQAITPACVVWTPAAPTVYTAGVVPTTVETLPAALHGAVLTAPVLAPAPAGLPVASPLHGFRSPRESLAQRGAGDSAGGSAVSVCGRHYERLRELGKGSFGVVWEVHEGSAAVGEPRGIGTLALKCSKATNKQILEACLLEAEVLQNLGSALPKEVSAANHVPRYISHCLTAAASHGNNQVLVVMSKLDGKPLDRWLYGVDENCFKTAPLTEVAEGPFPEGVFATRSIRGACATTTALLAQMAPVFEPLNGIAYHRDVSAHNFLLRENATVEHFALLDFGLAVRAPSWEHEYQTHNISGDPRYFTPAAWMLMVYGHKYLEAHPDPSFLEQYKHRMDHYSLGLLSLEVLFGLWRGPEAEAEVLEGSADEIVAAVKRTEALVKAQRAWRALWMEAVRFFQMFHAKGFTATCEALARSQAVSQYVDKLRVLCSELRSAAAEAAADAEIAAVLKAAVGLLDPRESLEWRELRGLLAAPCGPGGSSARGVCGTERCPKESRAGDRHGDAVGAACAEPTAESAGAEVNDGLGALAQATDPPLQPVRKFKHRRNWTVDEAVSLTRRVPEVRMDWNPPVAQQWLPTAGSR